MHDEYQQLLFDFAAGLRRAPVELLSPDDVYSLASQELFAELSEGSLF